MGQRFNQVETPDYHQSWLRKSRLVKAVAVATTATALFSGCGGQGSEGHSTDKPSSPQAATASSENGAPIKKNICDIPALKAAVGKFLGLQTSDVSCEYQSVAPGHTAATLAYTANNEWGLDDVVQVIIDPDHSDYDTWASGDNQYIQVESAPDINGNPAIWMPDVSSLATPYQSQEINITVANTQVSSGQRESFALQAASAIENATG